jgi:hypothetical protein
MNNTIVIYQNCTGIDGIRSITIGYLSIFDIIFTVILAYYASKIIYFYSVTSINRTLRGYLKYYIRTQFCLILLGIIVHVLMDINTMLNYYLHISDLPNRKKCDLY